MFFRTRGSDLLSFCIFDITITKESGNNIKDILFHSVMNTGEWASIGCYLYHSVCRNRTDERSGKKDQVILSHSVAVHREWENKKAVSFPLERDSKGLGTQMADILPTLAAERIGVVSVKRTIAREQ